MSENDTSPETDPLLKKLVELIVIVDNLKDGLIEYPINLFVNGLIISGTIISFKDFMLSDPILDKFLETHTLREKQKSNPTEFDDDPWEFIHLKNGRTLAPGQLPIPNPHNDGFFWRGRLSSIDGFFLNQFDVSDEG